MHKTLKTILLILTMNLILLGQIGLITPKNVWAASTSDIKVGDYVQFGRYYNEVIKWRVINKNSDGSLMLLSERILSMKPFDANGDSNGNEDGESSSDRVSNGSNHWETSNLREWLNSNSEIVNYTSQAPDNTHVNNGINNYETEAGFLTNFTDSEQNAIQSKVHKSILSSEDSSSAEGGTEAFAYNTNVEDMVQNYNNAYYKNVEDSVFLLDVKEVFDYVFSRGYEHKRRPTEQAVDNSEYKISSENYWQYWLRTPDAVTAHSSLFICYQGIVNFDNSYNGDHGVLPALNLKSNIPVVGGDGTDGLPYVVIGDISSIPDAPTVSGVQITGDARIGKTLTASYNYLDINADPESNSDYRWLVSDTSDGVFTPIEGEISLSYSIKESDVLKYLKFEVTPRTTVDPQSGDSVQSPAVHVYKSDNALLSSLRYNGVSIPDFNPNHSEYEIVLPSGSVQVPTISATPEDDLAQTQIINATDLTGKTMIKVTAEDSTIKTYEISFKVTPSYIESAHPYLADFDNTWTYSLNSAYSAMQITFSELTEVEEGYDFISIMDGDGNSVQGSPFTGKELMGKTVKVPGSTVKIRLTSDSDDTKYGFAVIDIRPELSLTSLKVNGTDIIGFEQNKLTYRYVVPEDVVEVPVITVEAELGASITIIPASNIPGNTLIKVNSSSGNLIKTYVIEFTHLDGVQLGDYIKFGRYKQQPILWRVINENNDGSMMLLSEKILSLKPFDANGDLTEGRGDSDRINYGSNHWGNSNLREWLNNENRIVDYTSQPPDDSHVYEGYNNYENEAGFLYNFTQDERDSIQPISHKNILSSADSCDNDGGTELHLWKSEIADTVQNFDDAYYKNLTDKVFLLDVKELHDYVYNRGYEYKRELTSGALANSEYKDSDLESWYYWLRTPNADNSYLERFVFDDGGGYDFSYAYDGKVGVLPALNLKAGFSANGGNGSESNPYLVGDEMVYSSTPVVELGKNSSEDGFGFYIGIKDIYEIVGNDGIGGIGGEVLSNQQITAYNIEFHYNSEQVKILDIYNEAGVVNYRVDSQLNGAQVQDSVYGSVNNIDGISNFNELIFVALAPIGSANETVEVTIDFASMLNQAGANITVAPVTLTFRRGSIIQKESTIPLGITDAIAGLQYLAGIRDAGLSIGDINPINMASIRPPVDEENIVQPSVKDVIALLQYLVKLRDDRFQVKP